MLESANKHSMYVIYDSVTNSVFSSIVLRPLLDQLEANRSLEITLVSFERKQLSAEKLMSLIPAHDRLHVVLLKKVPFIGTLSLWISSWQLFWLFCKMPSTTIIARGPLAGWICINVLRNIAAKHLRNGRKREYRHLPPLIIQARGLAAEEFRYAKIKEKTPLFKSCYCCLIYKSLKHIEKEAYRQRDAHDIPSNVIIEAVSPALKDYLIKKFNAHSSKISLAMRDIPRVIPLEQRQEWRDVIRKQLAIPLDTYAYCYSGSYKPWQCPEEIIHFFIEQHKQNSHSILLIYTTDKEPFINIFGKHRIPPNAYRILNVPPQQLLQYLAAADAGLLFREPDVINWVSRPTKVLEYLAVGLRVIHNNTVAWLIDQEKQNIYTSIKVPHNFKNCSNDIC